MNASLHSARFYAILDTGYVPRLQWRDTCAALITGGADLVQIRAKHATPSQREELVQEVLPLFPDGGPDVASTPSHRERAARTQGPALDGACRVPFLIINDDVDLCARTPGAGLHIGQDDMSPAEARARIGAGRVLGLSTHSWAQASAAMALPSGVLSYIAVGPVFATPTKPDYVPVGLDLVRQVAAARPALPWFVIGGITRTNLAQVVAAGATRVVVVSDVLRSSDPAEVIRNYRNTLCAVSSPA